MVITMKKYNVICYIPQKKETVTINELSAQDTDFAEKSAIEFCKKHYSNIIKDIEVIVKQIVEIK